MNFWKSSKGGGGSKAVWNLKIHLFSMGSASLREHMILGGEPERELREEQRAHWIATLRGHNGQGRADVIWGCEDRTDCFVVALICTCLWSVL